MCLRSMGTRPDISTAPHQIWWVSGIRSKQYLLFWDTLYFVFVFNGKLKYPHQIWWVSGIRSKQYLFWDTLYLVFIFNGKSKYHHQIWWVSGIHSKQYLLFWDTLYLVLCSMGSPNIISRYDECQVFTASNSSPTAISSRRAILICQIGTSHRNNCHYHCHRLHHCY